MQLRIHNLRGFWSGLIFTGVGGFALYYSLNYRMGTATHMGPGYFPFGLALALTALGAASMLLALRFGTGESLGEWHLPPLLFVIAGVVAFGLLVDRAGLIPAIAALLLLACYQRVLVRPLETLAICLVLTGVAVGLFIYGLQMPFDMVASWD